MAVQYLNYDGKKYPVKLGHYSLRLFQQEHGASLEDAQKDMKLFQHLIWKALNQGARKTKEELDLEFEDMVDVLDECMIEFALAIPKFFPSQEDIPEELKEELGKLKGMADGTAKPTSTKSRPKRKSN